MESTTLCATFRLPLRNPLVLIIILDRTIVSLIFYLLFYVSIYGLSLSINTPMYLTIPQFEYQLRFPSYVLLLES